LLNPLSLEFLSLAAADRPAARRRTQHVQDERHRAQSVEQEGDDGAEHTAVGVGGFGRRHHDGDVQPGDGDEMHG